MEDLAYRRMLDWCYLHEKSLPVEISDIARLIRMRSHTDSIASVLREFFESTADGWVNRRVQQEISRFSEKSEKARQSAKARWDANALPKQSECNANQEPITKNQEPIDIEAKASLSGTSFHHCPQQEILKLWKEKLPHLTQPRIWEGARAAALRQRWVQASRPSAFNKDGYDTRADGLEWWGSFFDYIATDTKLPKGFESQGRIWKPDLEWVVNATNFQKIIDGKYDL
jgi:uncharacterized protein YdaU (DUF1376 family)